MKAKVSAQAQQVLNVLAARRCHLTADEILENLEGIGTATVYRALDHLTGNGPDSQALPRQKERGLRIHSHQSHAFRL